VFERQAVYCDGRSPLYARVCRRLADDPRVGGVAPDLGWDLPLRLLGGLHYLVLGGEESWDDLDAALERHGPFLRRWCAEQEVQTNEVQRSWALLPAFLSLDDGRPFDLLELGPSAGLNLLWDRYAYRYSSGVWGSGELELVGNDRIAPPATLFERRVQVVRRRGVDLSPVDVTTADGARVLQAFVWPDQTGRLNRLRRAIEPVTAQDFANSIRRVLTRTLAADYVTMLALAQPKSLDGCNGLTSVIDNESSWTAMPEMWVVSPRR